MFYKFASLREKDTYMPPKQKFSSEDVIDAAYNIVRREGWNGLSARSIANELNASTRPIYDYLKSMQHIEEEVVKRALASFVECISRDRTGDKWLDQALGYVIFANKEKHLFRCLNDEKHTHLQQKWAPEHWKMLGEQLVADKRFQDMPEDEANRIRAVRWIFLHGMSFLVSNGWMTVPESGDKAIGDFIDMNLEDFLTKVNKAIYAEFKKSLQ
jgi:AcrR family transcriptional regulator